MSDENGTAPEPESDVITITLTLTPTRQGLALNVAHTPGVFPDTVIDACLRAARFYEHMSFAQELMKSQQEAAVRAVELRRSLGGIVPRMG